MLVSRFAVGYDAFHALLMDVCGFRGLFWLLLFWRFALRRPRFAIHWVDGEFGHLRKSEARWMPKPARNLGICNFLDVKKTNTQGTIYYLCLFSGHSPGWYLKGVTVAGTESYLTTSN